MTRSHIKKLRADMKTTPLVSRLLGTYMPHVAYYKGDDLGNIVTADTCVTVFIKYNISCDVRIIILVICQEG